MTQPFGTKAETLALLHARGFSVPSMLYFEAEKWRREPHQVVASIIRQFPDQTVAVRSSARAEDTATASMAGVFRSILHVSCEEQSLSAAIAEVATSFSNPEDQVLVQPMLQAVQIAGVIMTRALDDGSPYYVINYDDVSGRTDTVTGGHMTTKMVHVYKGVSDHDFDSPRLREALRLARSLEKVFGDTPLDIEFAVDSQQKAWLLQVRPICSSRHWKAKAAAGVSERIQHVETYVRIAMRARPGFYGKRTLYGVMPDWNPAEIIGLVPRPLAFSLYRHVITRSVWSEARACMGYHPVPPTDLMVSMAGRPYIDVRASFNSFLPAGLPTPLAEKLVNAWLDRLDANPALHDKVEFEIVPSVLDFDTQACLEQRYPGLLNNAEMALYLEALRNITNAALSPESTLCKALSAAKQLHSTNLPPLSPAELMVADTTASADCAATLVLQLPALLEDCCRFGTLPFSIAARHAFMAESLLRSAVRCNALSQERLEQFKRSIHTVSGELSRDFEGACENACERPVFLERYGHLRPGTYDILSPCYADRPGLFDVTASPPAKNVAHNKAVQRDEASFVLAPDEREAIQAALDRAGLHATAENLLDYARTAIAGREYAKFVFTRHISRILELLSAWGSCLRLTRMQVAMLPLESVLDTLFSPLPAETRTHFLNMARRQQQLHELASSFKLAQLIRSTRDVYIAPMHRSVPNFITSRRVEAPVICLSATDTRMDLAGKLVCIESADPGYDWIFTRNITGLITRFGGSNSHMAIRCAEYGLPAAIGCGTLLYESVAGAASCILDCGGKTLRPLVDGVL